MRKASFTIPASFDYLRAWLSRHVRQHPPADEGPYALQTLLQREIPSEPDRPQRSEVVLAILVASQEHIAIPVIEIAVAVTGRICDVVAYGNESQFYGYFDQLLREISGRWPEVADAISEQRARWEDPSSERRRGRLPTPPEEKARIVTGWLDVQGRMTQDVYCGTVGISPSLLRSWLRERKRQEDAFE